MRGAAAPVNVVDDAIFASCGHRAARQDRIWRVTRSPAGRNVLIAGFIDNASDVAQALGCPDENSAGLYGAAHDAWGDDVDLRLIGDYCALVDDPVNRVVRLARSPWRAPPLHYFHNDREVCVASVPRVLHACGLPAELDRKRLIDNLYLNLTEDRGWYKGSHDVALGASVHIDPERRRVRKYYDMLAPREVRLATPETYVEATDALLREACSKTLGQSGSPGILLSGGLDSSNVAARLLDCLPEDRRLKAFTFRPLENYVETSEPGLFGDDGPAVMQFAAMHPRLDLWMSRNDGYGFDAGMEKLFLAMGIANVHMPNGFHFHSLFEQAARSGCDLLLDANSGNHTFSNHGPWAFTEFFLTGRWKQLFLALKKHQSDGRTLLRTFFSLAIAPLVPDAAWRGWRRWRGAEDIASNRRIGALRAEVEAAESLREKARRDGVLYTRPHISSRRAFTQDVFARGDMHGGDIVQGFEQVYGLTWRDVTTYRPFIEFCQGLPVDVFVRDGRSRWLARELGRGLMPESQRLETRHGVHSCDWHERLTPRLPELREELVRASRDPDLADIIDFDRLLHTIDNWPDHGTLEDETFEYCAMAIPRAVMTARYMRFVTGRNQP